MLAWEGFSRAKKAQLCRGCTDQERLICQAGTDPEKSSIRNRLFGYARRVVTVEWPAQAEGRMVDQDSIYLSGLNKMALALQPSEPEADGDLHARKLSR